MIEPTPMAPIACKFVGALRNPSHGAVVGVSHKLKSTFGQLGDSGEFPRNSRIFSYDHIGIRMVTKLRGVDELVLEHG
jgi:hypothetical protein